MKMKRLITLFSFLVVLLMNFGALAQVVQVPTPAPLTPKPQMSQATIMAKRKFYIARYSQSKQKNFKGSLTANFGSDSTTQDYAKWFSSALKKHPQKRYFKIKADFAVAMRSWTDIWVYDRQLRHLRYLQRHWSFRPPKVTTYRVYRNVDDAAFHVLAEDNQPLNKVAEYTAR